MNEEQVRQIIREELAGFREQVKGALRAALQPDRFWDVQSKEELDPHNFTHDLRGMMAQAKIEQVLRILDVTEKRLGDPPKRQEMPGDEWLRKYGPEYHGPPPSSD